MIASDILHAHALGVHLDEPIPVDRAAISRAQRAAYTAALAATPRSEEPARAWLADQDAISEAVRHSCDMQKAAERWCDEARMWRNVAFASATIFGVALIISALILAGRR